jgi:transcriptional regulator with XRE-family HTH domain
MGVSQSKVSSWENGSFKPSEEEVQTLSSVFKSETPAGTLEVRGSKLQLAESESSIGEWMRANRDKAGLSQQEIGERIGVSQSQISTWENGSSEPSEKAIQSLSSIFGTEPPVTGLEAPFGEWLKSRREELRISRTELAKKTGISSLTIYFIETGRTESPRESTIRSLEQALGSVPTGVKKEIKEERVGGELEFLGPFPMDAWEENVSDGISCVYVLYDELKRPVRIGETEDLRRRMREYKRDAWWCRPPTVDSFAYVEVSDPKMRRNTEVVMIKLIGAHAIFNIQDKI